MIAGIDPSLCSTGVVVGDGHTHHARTFRSAPAAYGTLAADHVLNRMDRCDRLQGQIMDWLHTFPIQVVYIEGYAFSRNGQACRWMIEFCAILRMALQELNGGHVRMTEVAPNTLKKFATHSGRATKEQMAARVKAQWGAVLATEDEVDAYALYRLGLCCEGLARPVTTAQIEAVARVLGRPVPTRTSRDPDQTVLSFLTNSLKGSPCPKPKPKRKPQPQPKSPSKPKPSRQKKLRPNKLEPKSADTTTTNRSCRSMLG